MPKTVDAHFRLRVSQQLKSLIEARADENNRSINAEIVARLEFYESWSRQSERYVATIGRLTEVVDRRGNLLAILNQALEQASDGDPRALNLLVQLRAARGLELSRATTAHKVVNELLPALKGPPRKGKKTAGEATAVTAPRAASKRKSK